MKAFFRTFASVLLAGSLIALVATSPTQDVPADAKAPEYPKKVQKKLWAKKDLRGKKAPAFVVEKWLNAEPDFKGKVVLIDLWATWCPPCRKLIPELQGFNDKFKDDLVVIGVSDEKPAVVQKFMDAQKITYPMAIDTKARMKNGVGVEGIPHVLIISSDGIVRWQGYPLEASEPLTEQIVQQIIDADKASRNSSPAGPKSGGQNTPSEKPKSPK